MARVCSVGASLVWFVVSVASVVMCFRRFLSSVCQLKSMENISRSPCISLCTAVIHGLSTIHVHGKMDDYTRT